MSKKENLIRYAGWEPPGRPRKYKTAKAFDAAVNRYVKKCEREGVHLTWTGLVLSMGFGSRSALDRYMQYEGFEESASRARLLIENSYENRLFENSPTGAIFALKNMGWNDKQELEHTSPDGSMVHPVQIVLSVPDDEGSD